MTIEQFVETWSSSTLREQAAAQSHFNELCQMVGHQTPTQADPKGDSFTFERHVAKEDGRRGRADVWYRGHFAWEYKGKHKNLDAAYQQLLAYKSDLNNPPLLVVCDFEEYRIYPQFENMSGKPIIFHNADLLHYDSRRFIEWLLVSPDKFKQYLIEEREQRERLTADLAREFASLADLMRKYGDGKGETQWRPMQVARFLTRILFSLFAEDVRLLPLVEKSSVFRYIVDTAAHDPVSFVEDLQGLFVAMDGQRQRFMSRLIPFFNGGLFASQPDENGRPEVLDITVLPGSIDLLKKSSDANWRQINPTIFGTMFERALDPAKRAQLGAHYTSESDIVLLVTPVLMAPLNREWEAIQAEAETDMQLFVSDDATARAKNAARERLVALHDRMMTRLGGTTVLDPACGSGNFLYVCLRLMKDLEGRVRAFFKPLELPFRDVVTPRQLYGIEKDEFAATLARVVVWIGYLQWRFDNEGKLTVRHPKQAPRPDDLDVPIIRDRLSADEPEHILCADAILRYRDDGTPYEPDWQAVDVIVGNPPFLGSYKQRQELGGTYLDSLTALYSERVTASSDLVCYWFEKARHQLEIGKVKRAGLLSTNSIRGGANREVLKRIKQSGDIFWAWADREWVLEGAAVRVSMVGFDARQETERSLDGVTVPTINSDLTTATDVVTAVRLPENEQMSFIGPQKDGPLDIPDSLAQTMLTAVNTSGRDNRDVIKPYLNGNDIVQRNRNYWIIDFNQRSEDEARLYEAPFAHLEQHVKPIRMKNNDAQRKRNWWRLGRSGDDYRQATLNLTRQIFTPRVAKHRVLVWVEKNVFPDSATVAFARDDDYFFGVLHSTLHELWSLRQGTSLEDRPRYTPTTTFETFPLPFPPRTEDFTDPRVRAISAAAQALHEERQAWLTPPDLMAMGGTDRALKDRTLTHLYNALERVRAGNGGSKESAAAQFAPRLAQLHDALDLAVLAAYGWDDLMGQLRTPAGDDLLLGRLLALNLARVG